jgi:Haem-binding domain
VRVEENTLKTFLRRSVVAGVIVLGVASLLVHPFGAVRAHAPVEPLLTSAVVDAETVRIFERSCQNCHSQNTDWPWYSYVAPVSWLIENDVHQARSHMNLSGWSQYSLGEKQELLAELAAAVRSRQMPPPRYTLMHRSAKLSQPEQERIYQWARGERHRLKSLATEGGPSADKAANQ